MQHAQYVKNVRTTTLINEQLKIKMIEQYVKKGWIFFTKIGTTIKIVKQWLISTWTTTEKYLNNKYKIVEQHFKNCWTILINIVTTTNLQILIIIRDLNLKVC